MLRGIELKQAYARGENISALLRARNGGANSEGIIETAYDLQAGSYVQSQQQQDRREYKLRYAQEIARVFSELGDPQSLIEAGVGEATTLSYVVKALETAPRLSAGVDLCWSRLRWARQWLQEQAVDGVHLAMATLTQLPFSDGAFDIVYTSHSIEPNHGQEIPILRELYRITGRYLVLLEPGYELASPEARSRMEQHGYCRNLPEHASNLGMKVIDHRLFPVVARAENPTALLIIEKDRNAALEEFKWACPDCHCSLQSMSGFWFCSTCFLAYPVLGGIPCLRRDKGIIASQLLDHSIN